MALKYVCIDILFDFEVFKKANTMKYYFCETVMFLLGITRTFYKSGKSELPHGFARTVLYLVLEPDPPAVLSLVQTTTTEVSV